MREDYCIYKAEHIYTQMKSIYRNDMSRATIHKYIEVRMSMDRKKYDVVELNSKLSNFDIVGVTIEG